MNVTDYYKLTRKEKQIYWILNIILTVICIIELCII